VPLPTPDHTPLRFPHPVYGSTAEQRQGNRKPDKNVIHDKSYFRCQMVNRDCTAGKATRTITSTAIREVGTDI
ncbi:hypothetical protein, partial [Streptomyces microflavus]|uniref:hypothetical protein n=1 Tax=Streptomyces microflavus TaxID=1919 RepID=UPI001943F8C1